MMRTGVVMLIIGLMAGGPVLATQREVPPEVERAALREIAASIPLGSRVKIQMRSGRRMTAILIASDADGVVVKRDTRVPEPALTVPFTELAVLRRDDGNGFSLAKAIGIGVAAGTGAMLTLIAVMAAVMD